MTANYQRQLDQKITRINRQFANFAPPELQVFDSPPQHFRQRAEFRIWHQADDAYYAMFQPGQKASANSLIKITQLPIADQTINRLMPQLLAQLKAQPILINRLYQVEFLSTLNGDNLISLIYHKALDQDWEQAAKPLEKKLNSHIIGRSRKQKITLSQDHVTEQLKVGEHNYSYRQIENGFTQPNAIVCQKMLHWSCQCAAAIEQPQDLLELYCGNGNFTLPLSKHFRQVLATEISKTSIKAAKHNIKTNRIDNIAIARLSAQELSSAISGERQFKRLQQSNIDLDNYQFSTIFVDPPRAGIDPKTLNLVQNHNHIIYISCNPDSLHQNLTQLHQTHHIKRLALFDQFPQTPHIEMGIWLQKNKP